MVFFEEFRKYLRECVNNYIPSVSVDLVIWGFLEGELKVLLRKVRGIDEWLLPGGWIRKDESLQAAAFRTLHTRIGLDGLFLRQFYTSGEPDRPKSFENLLLRQPGWREFVTSLAGEEKAFLIGGVFSIGFYTVVDFEKVDLTPDFKTNEYRWSNVAKLPPLHAGHDDMLNYALKSLRREVNYMPVIYNFLPEEFTMTELQTLYETILGRSQDRRNFHSKMMASGMLERLENSAVINSDKSSWLYRFIKLRYVETIEEMNS